MTVLDVFLNGRRLCRAGVGEDGVLDAIVSWAKLTGPAARAARRLKQPLQETRLHVGGLREDTHRRWVSRDLKSGDRVTVAVVRAASFDQPIHEKPIDPTLRERAERRSYARLKRKFEGPATPASERKSRAGNDGDTRFLNVDLDIWSTSPLQPLVKAFGPKVFALHVGKETRRRHGAHLELAGGADRQNPDELIGRFVKLVKRLPRSARRSWNRASVREFSIGVQAATKPFSYELRLQPKTLRAAASVNARVVLTVYGAM